MQLLQRTEMESFTQVSLFEIKPVKVERRAITQEHANRKELNPNGTEAYRRRIKRTDPVNERVR